MEQNLLHKHIVIKKQKLEEIRHTLKNQFIGLDAVIDEVMSFVSTWYLFPEAQFRPTVINLWGMTGSGKTALIQKLIELLDYKKLYAQMDMGEFESDSASWIKSTFTGDLEFFDNQACVLCLDEFQFARTLDNNGNELGKDKLRVIWDLIDSGKINYIPGSNSYYLRRAELCLKNLLRAEAGQVVIRHGQVVENADLFLEIFKGFYFDDQWRYNEAISKDYFLSKDFIEGIHDLYNDENLSREILKEKIQSSGIQDLLILLAEGIKTLTGVKQMNLSKALIFILGNLDEAFYMSGSLNPDISADELYEATSRINISHIKAALKKRFRHEQIARLGNNHIIYKSFTNAHFRELIRRELQRVSDYMQNEFGFTLQYHSSIHELVYNEGVFPTQGTRPVLTTVKNLIETWLGKLAVECIEKDMKVSAVDWSYCDDKYVFVFKDRSNQVLNIYEEPVNLKIDSLRKSGNENIQAHTAVHEAGHAILAALTLRILPSVVLSKTAADNCDGFCLVNFPEDLTTREVLKKDIVISLGGYVAEKMIFGAENTSSGVYSDLENASSLANKAIKYYGMGSDPLHIAVNAANNNEYFFNKAHHHEEALNLIQSCVKTAEEILDANKLLLLKMSEYLSCHNRMEEALIGQFIREYSVEAWVKTEGFIRKENYFSFHQEIKKQINELEHHPHSLRKQIMKI
ncbi:MAG: hypothetical protein JST26_08740 [Bacteroidetes bacterium]|nr:hypothetical protein [Bacteroidota bacterium]